MGKKRKSVPSSVALDEVDRSMYSTFCSAANSLSHLYTHSMNQQKLSFLAGERHGYEKLYQWILRQQEGGSRVNTSDILNYLQNEMDYGTEDSFISARSASTAPNPLVKHGLDGPSNSIKCTRYTASKPSLLKCSLKPSSS